MWLLLAGPLQGEFQQAPFGPSLCLGDLSCDLLGPIPLSVGSQVESTAIVIPNSKVTHASHKGPAQKS